MSDINIGIIGLGDIGKIHLYNCFRLKGAHPIAVADISKTSLLLAKRMGITRIYHDYNELLEDPRVHAVIISLPNYLHLDCAKKAASMRKHILIEKPLALNPQEGKEILWHVKENGIKLAIGYFLRFSQSFRILKHQFDKGSIGHVQIAAATFIGTGPFYHRTMDNAPVRVPDWWFQKEKVGGGALLDLGCHMINLLTWYFGNINDIKAYLGYRFNMDLEDHALCLMKFENGTIGVLSVGWFSPGSTVKIDLFGTAGCVSEKYNSSEGMFNFMANAIRRVNMHKPILGTRYELYYEELQNFINSLIRGKGNFISGEEGQRDLEMIFKAYESSSRINLE